MSLLTSIISACKKSEIDSGKKENFIFYKIVDFTESDQQYILQCINTNRIFHSNVHDIVMDVDILYGLHPIQACYIGIAYGQCTQVVGKSTLLERKIEKRLAKYQHSRYGQYQLFYQQKKGIIGFVCKKTHKEFSMDVRDLALSQDFIKEFDAIEAFFIGQEVGRRLKDNLRKNNIQRTASKKSPHLILVK